MKHITHFTDFTFESGNASFDWLRVQKNEAYFDLIEILRGELFDDYDISPISPKEGNEFTYFDDEPTDRFWAYCVNFPLQPFVSRQEEVKDKEIDKIVVFNILHKDYPEFKKRLVQLKERAQDFIGREIILGEEAVGSPDVMDPESDYWDFIIKIGKMI